MLFYRYTYKTDSRSVVEYEVKKKEFYLLSPDQEKRN